MLVVDVRVVDTAVRADRAIERRFLAVNVMAVERGVGTQGRENGATQLGGNVEFAQELLVGRRWRRNMIAAELRRARGRGDQNPRDRTAAASKLSRELERDHRAHAVAEKREGLVRIGLNRVGESV